MKMQIYVSGTGAISCAGLDVPTSIRNMFSTEFDRKPAPASDAVGTTLQDPVFELMEFAADPDLPRSHALTLTALKEALDQAELTEQDLASVPTGLCFGTTVALQLNNLPLYASIRSGEQKNHSTELQQFIRFSPAEYFHRRLHLTGPKICISNVCASGSDVLGIASSWIDAGICERVIAIGADDMNCVPIAGFHALGVASPEPCTPFDRSRKGLNLGEGAGVLILESEKLLEKRGKTPSVRLAGYSNACDAYHITAPHPEGRGLRKAIENALQAAGIGAESIAFINAHGTATQANDLCEGQLFPRIFGPSVRYFSTKGWTGHTLGAAGALEGVFTIEMLKRGMIPASRGFRDPDPEIPVPPVSSVTKLDHAEYALSDSLAFGGSNAAVIFQKL